MPLFQYLSFILDQTLVHSQMISTKQKNLRTLRVFQKLLGDLDWVRPSLGISNSELTNLFQTQEGDRALNSPRCVTPAAQKELDFSLNRPQKSYRFIPGEKVWLLVSSTPKSPTGTIAQLPGLLE